MNAKEIVASLTLEEKSELLFGKTFFGTCPIDRVGLRSLMLLDGGTGVNFEQLFQELAKRELVDAKGYTEEQFDRVSHFFFEQEKLSAKELELRALFKDFFDKEYGQFDVGPGCYPPGILLGSTWNPAVIREVGNALGIEAARYHIDVLLGTPNINLLRDPRNGRFFEGYSEDPYLAGELAKELVKGVQANGVAANVKHFAANNLEKNRYGLNEIISKRALYEIYFPGFKACITEEAKVKTLMLAYIAINGAPCTANEWLVKTVLRDEWGFEGLTVSDWGACLLPAQECVQKGNDLVMPNKNSKDDLLQGLKDGTLLQSRLDEACEKLVGLILDIDSKENSSRSSLARELSVSEYQQIGDKAAYLAASEGIVLLINKDSTLPAPETASFKLYGEGAKNLLDYGGGSAQVFTNRKTSFEACLEEKIVAENADYSIVFASIGSAEGSDRQSLELDEETILTIKKISEAKKSKIVLVLNTPGPVILEPVVDSIDACLCVFFPGMMGTKALSDIILGKVNSSGKLPCTFPKRMEDMPSYLSYPDSMTALYSEDIFVGYRGYEKTKTKPAFCFGYGLSYSEFIISKPKLEKNDYSLSDGEVRVFFDIKNTSDIKGKETVQLYVGDPVSVLKKPVKELRAFCKLELEPGESKTQSLSFSIASLSSYDMDYEQMLVEDGYYDVYLGASSEAAALIGSFYLMDGSKEYQLGSKTKIQTIKEHKPLLDWLFDEIRKRDLDLQRLINALRYCDQQSIAEIYGDEPMLVEAFDRAANEYRKP